MQYEQLLKKAKKEIPNILEESSRFELTKVKGHIEGNKTIVTNFGQIASLIHREPQHILKFLQRELATPAEIDGNRLILKRKISSSLINSKVELYVNIFVICPECKKPDTKLLKENKILLMKCLACGGKHTVKAKI